MAYFIFCDRDCGYVLLGRRRWKKRGEKNCKLTPTGLNSFLTREAGVNKAWGGRRDQRLVENEPEAPRRLRHQSFAIDDSDCRLALSKSTNWQCPGSSPA